MPDAPRQPAPSRRRRIVLALVAVDLVVLLLVGGYVWLKEHTAYYDDVASCYSDNMFVLKERLNDYAAENDGRLPATFDEFRAYVKEKSGRYYDVCVVADAPFIWMPEGVKTDDGCSVGNSLRDAEASHGRPVVLMCPPESHGWLRKYAFGLVRDDDGTFRFVRIRHSRATKVPR